jgi:chemotaxis protein MotB
MSRRTRRPDQENHERWLVSYADFITLLFAFFVMLYANSNVNKQRAQAISDSFKDAIQDSRVRLSLARMIGRPEPASPARPAESPPDKPVDLNTIELLPSLEKLNSQLGEEIAAGRIDVHLERRGLVISLKEATFFGTADDTIDPATYPTLEKIATALRPLPNPIRMEGHTDSVPIRTIRFRSNWELSAARSIAMLELFAARFSIPRERLAIAGFAETAPVASNESETGRARNRRVDVIVLNTEGLRTEPRQALPADPRR